MRSVTLITLSAALLIGGCVVPTGPVEVTRFNRAAEGASYGSGSYVVKLAVGSAGSNNLAASPYLAAVAREMRRIGYSEGTNGGDVVAEIDFGTSEQMAAKRSPVSVGVGGSTGSYGSGFGLGLGINLGSGNKASVESILSVRIVRQSDNVVIWEGRAAQLASKGSPAAQPGIAASKLAQALFKDFPGQSGETISVP